MSAWCRKTLVGMQPTCRQVPPRNGSFSTTATFNPHCAARIAATYPPGPLPITTKSYLAKPVLHLMFRSACGPFDARKDDQDCSARSKQTIDFNSRERRSQPQGQRFNQLSFLSVS